MTSKEPILILENLCLSIQTPKGKVEILKDINMEIGEGECWALAGESGAGKSMTVYSIAALLPKHGVETSGKILFKEESGEYQNIFDLPFDQRTVYCSERVSLIFQSAIDALNPFESIGKQWGDTIRIHKGKKSKEELSAYMKEEMKKFGLLDSAILKKYPHQLSGGMRQRIAIAMALESNAKILMADEPTTSLDALNQRLIVDLMQRLCQERGLTLLYVSHNLALLESIATHALIMKDGRIVESGSRSEIFERPTEAYTKQLLMETRKLGGLKDE